jgi:hypothetical protein
LAERTAQLLPQKPEGGAGSRTEQLCLLVKTILRVIGRKRAADCRIFLKPVMTGASRNGRHGSEGPGASRVLNAGNAESP